MRLFENFKQYVFTHLFPYYYKENDTYQNPQFEGKGILERFIDICSEYFDKNITDSTDYLNIDNSTFPSLNNFMDIIDLDKTPDLFLNYLWEYFGEFPYAYGLITNGESLTKENLEVWMKKSSYKNWFKTNFIFPRANPRNLLKYIISLYKIRCTEPFYNILGNFYGVHITVSDPYSNRGLSTNRIVASYPNEDEENPTLVCAYYTNENPLWGDNKAYYRRGDEESCFQCWPLYFTVGLYQDTWDKLNLDNDPNKKLEIEKAFIRIFERYKPIWIKGFVSSDNNPTKEDSTVTIDIYIPEVETITDAELRIGESGQGELPDIEPEPEPVPEPTITEATIYLGGEDSKYEPDTSTGKVGLLLKDGTHIAYKDVPKEGYPLEQCSGVTLRFDDTAQYGTYTIQIAMQDASQCYFCGAGIYKKDPPGMLVTGLTNQANRDYRGKLYTDLLLHEAPNIIWAAYVGKNYTFPNGAPGYLGTLAEYWSLTTNQAIKNEIQDLLSRCGGQPFQDAEYWTTSLCTFDEDDNTRWTFIYKPPTSYTDGAHGQGFRWVRPIGPLEPHPDMNATFTVRINSGEGSIKIESLNGLTDAVEGVGEVSITSKYMDSLLITITKGDQVEYLLKDCTNTTLTTD